MSYEIVAYSERESCDPITGEVGILRKEWRLESVKNWDENILYAAFGAHWRMFRPGAEWLLLHRYIRRGKPEPWTPVEVGNTRGDVLHAIDGSPNVRATSTELQAMWDQELLATEARIQESAAQAIKELSMRDAEEQKRKSEAAFARLRDGKHSHLALAWNDWIIAHMDNHKLKAEMRSGARPEMTQDYQAVLAAVTVPAKRAAIRHFLQRWSAI